MQLCECPNLLLGLSLLKKATPGMRAVSVIMEAFMTAKMPLAASLWPIFGLTCAAVSDRDELQELEVLRTAPTSKGLSFGRVSFRAWDTALTSIGSPTGVPVPCLDDFKVSIFSSGQRQGVKS